MKKIYLILGMHRSATSLTTEVFSSYGMFVGRKEDLWEADQNNQRGYFENKEVVLLDDKILYEHGMHWAMIGETFCISKSQYTNEINLILDNFQNNTKKDQPILIKDPRMCLLEPIWRKEIKKRDLACHIVLIFRHPYEVAKSLQTRDNINFCYALKIWFYNNLYALCSILDCDQPVLVLNHNDYFCNYNEQIKKIEKYLQWDGINEKLESIVDSSLRHNHSGQIDEYVHKDLAYMVLDMYNYLIELSSMSQIKVTANDISKYKTYLKNMVNVSHSKDGLDIQPKAFCNCLNIEKKRWCMYQIKNKSDLLAERIKDIFRKACISNVSIYGYGTLTHELLPILRKSMLKVDVIYDKRYATLCVEDTEVNISKPCDEMKKANCVINTVINYGVEVQDELYSTYKAKKVIDLYEMLCFILEIDNKQRNKERVW